MDSIPEPSVDPDTPGGDDGGGGGGSSITLPITAPLWMSDTGFSKWTDTDGITERSTTFANGAATPEQPSWYEDIPYGKSGYTEHSYVDTHWYANVGNLDARLRHTASDGSRIECSLYETSTEQGTFSVKGGGQATHYRLLHFSYGGQTYLKIYRQIDILPGRDMLDMSSWKDYEFPDDTVYPPRYQFIGHTLVRWYVVATGKHLDGKNSQVPQSREQQLRGIKDAASAWHYLKTLPSPITTINSLSTGDQILGATSFVNRGTGKIRVWMNCTDYASKLNGDDYGFAFWGDRYPIP